MSKTYEGLSVRQASWKIQEDEAAAKRLFKRYVDTARKRASTFEKKGLTSSYGYRRLRDSLNEAKGGFSAEALSHISFTLASEHTSYQRQREITKKTVETLNVEFGEWDDKGRLTKPFITEAQMAEFGELIDLLNSVQTIYSSEQKARMSSEYIQTVAKKGLDWEEEKVKLLQAIEKATENNQNFSMRQYTTRLHRRASRK